MDFAKKSRVTPTVDIGLANDPRMQQRRRSLIEDYYAWRENEFEDALADAAKKEALHKTPPPTPVYERRVTKIDGKTYEKNERKKLLEEIGDHSLDIFKSHKKKKFAMYPVVPHTPDETPSMSPNLSSGSLTSSHFHHDHHTSFPHLPDIEESDHEEEDNDDETPTKPIVLAFKSTPNPNLTDNVHRTELEKLMERKLLPNDPNKPNDFPKNVPGTRRAPSGPPKRVVVDIESGPGKQVKFSRWEIAQEFVPWVMIVTSIIQIGLFIVDRHEFFQLLVFSPHRTLEMWRFITYAFLHTNFTHLILNVFIQILLAIPLEFEQNHGRVAAVYFGGSILGACGVMLFGPSTLVVGASAGVYSLLLSHIPHTILNKRTIRYRYVRLGGVLFLCLCDLIHTIVHFSTGAHPRIGVWAHIFGALGGLLLGMAVYKFIDPVDALPDHLPKYYASVKRASVLVFLAVIGISLIYGIVH